MRTPKAEDVSGWFMEAKERIKTATSGRRAWSKTVKAKSRGNGVIKRNGRSKSILKTKAV